jgi:hypothetical protein
LLLGLKLTRRIIMTDRIDEVVSMEDEPSTLVLVNPMDEIVGSISPDELELARSSKVSNSTASATDLIHRTTSLYVVAKDDERLLVSSSFTVGKVVSASLGTCPYFGMAPSEVTSPAPPKSTHTASNDSQEQKLRQRQPHLLSNMTSVASCEAADIVGARNALLRTWAEEYLQQQSFGADQGGLPPPPPPPTVAESLSSDSESLRFIGRFHHARTQQMEYVFHYVVDTVGLDAPLWEDAAAGTKSTSAKGVTRYWMNMAQLQQLVQCDSDSETLSTTKPGAVADPKFHSVITWMIASTEAATAGPTSLPTSLTHWSRSAAMGESQILRFEAIYCEQRSSSSPAQQLYDTR